MYTSKSRNILYLCNTYVEADNIAPLIDLVRTGLPECHQGLCILQPGKTALDTEILPLLLEGVEIFTPSEIVRCPTRTLISVLMRLRRWLDNCTEVERLSFFRKPLRLACRLVMSLRRVLLQSSRVDFSRAGKYEVLIAAAGIYDAILDPLKFDASRRAEAHPLRQIIQRQGVRVVLLPETYDQFTPSRSKNYVVAPMVEKRVDSILVMAGYEAGCRSVFHSESQQPIGCPRYTEEWCTRISKVAVNPIGLRKKSDREVYLLYLPLRVKTTFPILTLEEAERVDVFLCNTLIKHSEIRLLVKRHPKSVGSYPFMCDLTEVPTERIEYIDGKVDTAQLVSVVDLVVALGSSVLPQFLWESIPVVLFDSWLQEQEYNYVYAPWCFKETEFSEVLAKVIAGEKKISRRSSAKREMMELFQLGMSSEKYKEQLVAKILKVTD